jgi:hypothetical protein
MPIPPTSCAFASIFTVATRANRIAPSELVPSLVRGEDYSVLRETAGRKRSASANEVGRVRISMKHLANRPSWPAAFAVCISIETQAEVGDGFKFRSGEYLGR